MAAEAPAVGSRAVSSSTAKGKKPSSTAAAAAAPKSGAAKPASKTAATGKPHTASSGRGSSTTTASAPRVPKVAASRPLSGTVKPAAAAATNGTAGRAAPATAAASSSAVATPKKVPVRGKSADAAPRVRIAADTAVPAKTKTFKATPYKPARPTTAPNAGGTTAASTTTTAASSSAHAGEIREGSRVVITKTGHRGVVKYIGTMKQAEGEFIGVELDLGAGLNDGSVMGRKMCESQAAQPMSKHVCVRAVHTLCTNGSA
eukprot:2248-Heterococcus_DN1.PRE.1